MPDTKLPEKMLEKRNLFRTSEITEEEEANLVDLYQDGEYNVQNPVEFEYTKICDQPAAQVILLELYHEGLSFSDLFTRFNSKMYQKLQEQAELTVSRRGGDVEEAMERMLYTFYNPYNPKAGKMFLYRSLTKLLSFDLVRCATHTMSSPDSYWQLTEDIGIPQVIDLLEKKFHDDWIIFEMLINNENTYNRFKLTMKWMENMYEDVDQLILLFNEPLLPAEIEQRYINYLIEVEGEDPKTIDQSILRSALQEKIQDLARSGLIEQDPQSRKLGITQRGNKTQRFIMQQINQIFEELKNAYLLNVTEEDITLTKRGIEIANAVIRDVYTDEHRLSKPPTMPLNDTDGHEIGSPMPIYIQMKKVQDNYTNTQSTNIYIPHKEFLGWKQELAKLIGQKMGPIGGLMAMSLMTLALGLWLTAIGNQYGISALSIGGIFFVVVIALVIYRKHWDQPDYIQEAKARSTKYEIRSGKVIKKTTI